MFFWAVASGFQDVSQDNGLSKGPGVLRYRKVSVTTGHYGWHQMSIVRDGREFLLSRSLSRESGELSHEQSSGSENRPDPFRYICAEKSN